MIGMEDRYAYYRRCRVFRRNGEQCKAPAMKGTHICYKHLQHAEMQERWKRQREKLLSLPGLGFGDFRSIQRTISAAAQAVIDGSIDSKVAGHLLVELQMAIKLLSVMERQRRARKVLPMVSADQRRSEVIKSTEKAQVIDVRQELRCSARHGKPRMKMKTISRGFKPNRFPGIPLFHHSSALKARKKLKANG